MNTHRSSWLLVATALVVAFVSYGASAAPIKEIKVKLSGDQEVPPVTSDASGSALFLLHPDGSISGTVRTEHIDGIAAHIHEAAAGSNGPVVVPLTKKSDHEWGTPEGAKLTPQQVEALKSGDLYVNVHTQAHKGGEIRGQLRE
jgi:CHRD domain